MIAYIDSSVCLRLVMNQVGALDEWRSIERGVASALVEVECLRTLDRFRLMGEISDNALAERRSFVYRLLQSLELVQPTAYVLSRASLPLPTSLGTLDAIHLATALLWQEHAGAELVMATHDVALGRAARSCGLSVIGV